jgi:hypothetical protein
MSITELATGVQFTVDQTGKVTAVVLTPELWERIVELLEDSEDMRTARAALAALKAAGGDRARAGWLKWEDVEHEVG